MRTQSGGQETPQAEDLSTARSIEALPAKISNARWNSLYSEDPREYADRLRLAGCPEKTLRVILEAQLYTLREKQLAAIAPVPLLANSNEKRAERIRIYNEKQAVFDRFDALAFDVAGILVLEEPLKQIETFIIDEALMQFISSARPEDGCGDVVAFLKRCNHFQSDLAELPPIARLRETLTRADWVRDSIAKVVPAGAQREFAERFVGFLVSQDLKTLSFFFTGPELQRFAHHVVEAVPDLQVPGLASALDSGDLEDRYEAAFESAMELALDPSRLVEWRMDKDQDYRRIIEALEIPRESRIPTRIPAIHQFYLLKEEAERSWMAILSQPYGDTERGEKLAQLSRYYKHRVQALLPEKAMRALTPPPYWMNDPGGSP
jgi:hypothetical protein